MRGYSQDGTSRPTGAKGNVGRQQAPHRPHCIMGSPPERRASGAARPCVPGAS